MAESIRDTLKRIAPEFLNLDDTVLDTWIADAQLDVPSATKLGSKYSRAVAYYTAHLLTISSTDISATGSGIRREKTSQAEIEYNDKLVGGTNVLNTKYWLEYQRLIRGSVRSGPFVLNGR